MLVVAPSFNKTKKVFGRTQIGNRWAGWLVFFPPSLLHVFSWTPALFFLACRWMSVFVLRRRPWYYYCIPVGLFLKPSTLWWQDPCSWISSSTVHVSLPIVSYPLFFIVFIVSSMALSSLKPKRGGGRSRSLLCLGFFASWKDLWMFCLRFWFLVGARWEDENGNNKLKSKHGPALLTPFLFMLSLSRIPMQKCISSLKEKTRSFHQSSKTPLINAE